jgi:hypothetical protein
MPIEVNHPGNNLVLIVTLIVEPSAGFKVYSGKDSGFEGKSPFGVTRVESSDSLW